MRSFVWKGTPPAADVAYDDEYGTTAVNFLPAYTEVFHPLSHHIEGQIEGGDVADQSAVFYWIKWDESTWAVALCLDDLFEGLFYLLNTPQYTAATWRALEESRPTTAMLVARWFDDASKYDISLSRIADPDTRAPVWLLASFFGNVAIDTAQDFMEKFQVGNSADAADRLFPMLYTIMLEGTDVLKLPNLFTYIGGDIQKAEFKQMLGYAKTAVKFASFFVRPG